VYPGSLHVGDVGLALVSDHAIWAHARDRGFVIVTKDEDFHRLSVLHGPRSTDDVIRLLRMRRDEVDMFVSHEEAAFLALA
jgi:predicted nuclease of predicted toxin-antitoxin system